MPLLAMVTVLGVQSAHAAEVENSVSLARAAAACQIGDGHTDFKVRT